MKLNCFLTKFLVNVSMVCGVMFLLAGCGGGGGGGAKKSGLKSNEFIGKLPAIYADYDLAFEAAKEKNKATEAKALKSQNGKLLLKAKEEYDKKWKELDSSKTSAVKAEWAKINGKSIPFTMSDDFKKLKLEVVSVKLNAEKNNLSVVIHPTENFIITGYSSNMNDYRYANYKVLAKDGSVIKTDGVMLCFLMASQSETFVKGEPVKLGRDGEAQEDLWGNLSVSSDPEKWVDFASVQFVSPNEK